MANLTGTAVNQSYTYTPGGTMTTHAMTATITAGNATTGAPGTDMAGTAMTNTLTTDNTTYGTYGVYGYNGEYTHTNLGLQYLRARYLNVATGTFMTKDTYAGSMKDILSQNRYTYAENNPVNLADPSGHAVKYGNKPTRNFAQQTTMSTAERARQATQNSVKNYAQTQRLATMTTRERALSATVNSIKDYIIEQRSHMWSNVPNLNVGDGEYDIVALQWPRSIAAKLEKAMCAAYDRCVNNNQEQVKGDYNDFKNALGFGESSNRYDVVNKYGFMGRYQIGNDALIDIGFKDKEEKWTELAKSYGIESNQDFLNNEEVQDEIFDLHMKKQLQYIEYYELDEYIGKTVNSIEITESGLLSAIHLVGIGAVKDGLHSDDLSSVKDGNGVPAIVYMEKYGGYRIDEIKEE